MFNLFQWDIWPRLHVFLFLIMGYCCFFTSNTLGFHPRILAHLAIEREKITTDNQQRMIFWLTAKD